MLKKQYQIELENGEVVEVSEEWLKNLLKELKKEFPSSVTGEADPDFNQIIKDWSKKTPPTPPPAPPSPWDPPPTVTYGTETKDY